MKAPPIKAKIDVSKILKEHLFKGAKGTYLDIVIWENEQPDKYGNTHAIQQDLSKAVRDSGVKPPYIGNGKRLATQAQAAAAVSAAQAATDMDDVPF